MAIHLDLDELSARIRDLDVTMAFVPETGFPYLRDKLGEVIVKNQQATSVMCDVIALMDLVRREIAAQALLYQQTGSTVHKDAAAEAKGQLETLKSVLAVLRLHLYRLRQLPNDIRLYTRTLEGALDATPHPGQGVERVEPPQQALPTALSSMARPLRSDPVDFTTKSEAESLEELFG